MKPLLGSILLLTFPLLQSGIIGQGLIRHEPSPDMEAVHV